MPLDTGDITVESATRDSRDRLACLRPGSVELSLDGHVGEALALARQSLGLEIDDIALATCVRRRYIQAIESFEFAALPPRPFVTGYIRAYAMALGLAPDPVLARFRHEAPAPDDALKSPVTLEVPAPWGRRVVIVATSLVVMAVAGWNLWRHSQAQPLRLPEASHAAAPPPAPGPLTLGAPPPTPPEASTPPAYQTPGLERPTAQASAAGTAAASPAAPAAGAAFAPSGRVYGAASGGGVILQARASTPVVVRSASGSVLFARQLAAGEAWRAPADAAGLTADVGEPASIEVFAGGLSKGPLNAPKTPLAKLSS